MSITIAHVSDTHDQPSIVRSACKSNADVVLITGDCMDNLGRVSRTHGTISRPHEIRYQESWYRKQAKKWAADLGDKPVIAVRGNHDFIGYTKWLSHYGATVYEITDDNPCVELLGQRFAGFRQVPYIAGEWAGETHDLSSFVEKAFSCDPTILVTHAPPAGILDADHAEVGGYGIGSLATNLFYGQHRVTHHFFGHAHKGCGIRDEGGITFINGAGTMRLIEVG